MIRPLLSISAALSILFLGHATASGADTSSPDIQAARDALAKYKDVYAAVRDGYLSTVACIDFPSSGTLAGMSYPAGGMGVHFVNFGAISPKVDALHPQVLLYEPVGDTLRLAGAEWFVPLSTGIKQRPELFGHAFYGPMAGHAPVMPAQLTHYDLHVWLWKDNRNGMFSPTNPDIKCTTRYSVHDATPMMPMNPR